MTAVFVVQVVAGGIAFVFLPLNQAVLCGTASGLLLLFLGGEMILPVLISLFGGLALSVSPLLGVGPGWGPAGTIAAISGFLACIESGLVDDETNEGMLWAMLVALPLGIGPVAGLVGIWLRRIK